MQQHKFQVRATLSGLHCLSIIAQVPLPIVLPESAVLTALKAVQPASSIATSGVELSSLVSTKIMLQQSSMVVCVFSRRSGDVWWDETLGRKLLERVQPEECGLITLKHCAK